MKAIIVGAGTIGYSIADYLIKMGYHIAVIDNNARVCRALCGKLDVIVLNGSGTSPLMLEEAGAGEADMLIAVTPQDDTNLLACGFARQFGIEKRIARIRSDHYLTPSAQINLNELGVTDIIEPEKEVVQLISQIVSFPAVTESANFISDTVFLRGVIVTKDMPIANKSLIEVRNMAPENPILIVLIIRNGEPVLPSGQEIINVGDEIIAIMPAESIYSFRRMAGLGDPFLNKIVVFGDNLITLRLMEKLAGKAERVILIDPDEEHAHSAASVIKGIEVIYGDGANADILQEIHVETADFFIAASGDNEDNLISCLLAKEEGAKRVISLSDTIKHIDLFHSLGLDYIINQNKQTTQAIIANIIKIPIAALLTLKNSSVEISRLMVREESKVCGRTLKDIKGLFKKPVVIGCVIHRDKVIIPTGETLIRSEDELILLFKSVDRKSIEKLF